MTHHLTDTRAEYHAGPASEPKAKTSGPGIIYYQCSWKGVASSTYFGYLLNGAGRHYTVNGEHVHVWPVGDRDIMPVMGSEAELIDRPAFDRLLARWVLPPALD